MFTAWTTPKEMQKFYAPSEEEFTIPIAESDPRVGGNYRVGMHHIAKNVTHIVSGQYCTVDFPRYLSYTWAWESPVPCVQETQVTLEFREQGGVTNVTLTHERFRDEGQRSTP